MRGHLARWRLLCLAGLAALGLGLLPAGVSATPAWTEYTGTTANHGKLSHYRIRVPTHWNRTLVLYSHGYEFAPAPVHDVGDDATGNWLLDHGYALAGSTYSSTGWALEQAFQDQIALLDVFPSRVGKKPKRTIAWGHSLGGMITAGLVQQFPERFAGALPMCGVLAGGPGVWNQGLDSLFAFKVLIDPMARIVNMNPATVVADYTAANIALDAAQGTLQGRARLALSAALADVPGWFEPASPEPAANDYTSQEQNQYQWDKVDGFPFGYFGRMELEQRSGGQFSWNTGVDYKAQLARSTDRTEVKALYKAAGLDLEDDLDKLNDAPRIAADPGAAAYVTRFITYNGDLDMPVLTLHTTGDGLVEVTDEQAYADVVRSEEDSYLLRQVYIHRAGHCTFTPAETISAFKTLVRRIDSGGWGSTSPGTMNSQARSLGLGGPSAFISYHPGPFLRPFDARSIDEGGDQGGGQGNGQSGDHQGQH